MRLSAKNAIENEQSESAVGQYHRAHRELETNTESSRLFYNRQMIASGNDSNISSSMLDGENVDVTRMELAGIVD